MFQNGGGGAALPKPSAFFVYNKHRVWDAPPQGSRSLNVSKLGRDALPSFSGIAKEQSIMNGKY